MNCFFLVVKSDPYQCEIVYVSDKISSYLGYSPNEIINHSLYQFICPSNHDRLRDYILNDHKGSFHLF
jgi:PAS domain-containing protein